MLNGKRVVLDSLKDNYTRIPNALFNATGLTPIERLILMRLYSYPNPWILAYTRLGNELDLDKSTIIRNWKSLKEKGWIVEAENTYYLNLGRTNQQVLEVAQSNLLTTEVSAKQTFTEVVESNLGGTEQPSEVAQSNIQGGAEQPIEVAQNYQAGGAKQPIVITKEEDLKNKITEQVVEGFELVGPVTPTPYGASATGPELVKEKKPLVLDSEIYRALFNRFNQDYPDKSFEFFEEKVIPTIPREYLDNIKSNYIKNNFSLKNAL